MTNNQPLTVERLTARCYDPNTDQWSAALPFGEGNSVITAHGKTETEAVCKIVDMVRDACCGKFLGEANE